MKTKIMGLIVLGLFLLSIISVTADLEVPEPPVEDLSEKYFCDNREYIDLTKDVEVKPLCKERPTVAKRGGGGFYIAKGKSLFGMTSKHDGKGFGVAVGNFFPNQVRRLQLNVDGNIMQLQIASKNKQTGFNKGAKAVHFKEIGAKGDLFTYEILSNLDKDTKYLLKIQVRTQEQIKVTLDGKPLKTNKLNVKSSNGYYYVELPSAGLLEVKRAVQPVKAK